MHHIVTDTFMKNKMYSLVIRHSRLPSENKAFNMFGSVCGSRRLLLRFCTSIRVASPFQTTTFLACIEISGNEVPIVGPPLYHLK